MSAVWMAILTAFMTAGAFVLDAVEATYWRLY